ncbi:hypothetical protein DB31_6157 [Hyalangium minutum]|uniref:Uncharacterized protein n=1 Tax=Hyalangium minutum TaxID=394096 RepID=A0A085VTU7_9BACT|nr:hypothetical protein DB31_6157 [Hyalangium minutum]
MERERGVHLRSQNLAEALRRLAQEDAVVQDTRAVEDAPHRRNAPLELRQGLAQTRLVRDIQRQHLDMHASPGQLAQDCPLRVRGDAAAPAEHEVPCSAPSQPSCHPKPERPQATGDEIGRVFARGERGGSSLGGQEHHLAHVPGPLHPPEGGDRAGDWEVAPRQRAQLAALESPGELDEHLLDLVGSHRPQVERLERDIGPVRRDALGLPQIHLAHLQEPAPRSHDRQALGDELAGERVEHQRDALSAGVTSDLVREVEGARAHHPLHAHAVEGSPLASAGRGEHLGTRALGDLHGGHANAPRRGVDEDPISPRDAAEPVQAIPCGEERDRDGGGLRGAHAFRAAHGLPGVHGDIPGEALWSERHHGIAHGHMGHPRTHARHGASALEPQGARIARVHPERVEHVAEVQTHRLDGDLDLSGCRLPAASRHQGQILQHSTPGDLQHVGLGIREPQRAARLTGLHQPREVALTTAPRELSLPGGARSQLRQQRDPLRVPGLQVDQDARQLGMLVTCGTAKAPQHRLRWREGLLLHALRSVSDEPQARREARRDQALDQVQRAQTAPLGHGGVVARGGRPQEEDISEERLLDGLEHAAHVLGRRGIGPEVLRVQLLEPLSWKHLDPGASGLTPCLYPRLIARPTEDEHPPRGRHRAHRERAGPPRQLVHPIGTNPRARGRWPGERHLLEQQPLDEADEPPLRIVDLRVAGPALTRRTGTRAEAGVAPQLLVREFAAPKALDPERKIGRGSALRGQRRAHHLQPRVDHPRVGSPALELDRRRPAKPGQGLAIAAPHLPDPAEAGPQLQTTVLSCLIEPVEPGLVRATRAQGLQRAGCSAQLMPRHLLLQPAGCVRVPGNLISVRLRGRRLEAPALAIGGEEQVQAGGLRHNERLWDDEPLQPQPFPRAPEPRGELEHGSHIERPGDHHPALELVVLEIRLPRGADFDDVLRLFTGAEDALAVRIEPRTGQRVLLPVDPVAGALERIVRHRGDASRVRLVEATPVDASPPHVQLAQAPADHRPVGLAAPQRGQEGALGHAVSRQPEQRRVRPHLQEHVAAQRGQGGHGLGEPDGLAALAPEVLRRHARGDSARDVGHPGDARGLQGHLRGLPLQRGQDGLHVRRVERVRDTQRLGLDALRGQLGGECLHGVTISGEGDALGAIESGDGEAALVARQGLLDASRLRANGQHGPGRAQPLHEARALTDEPQALFERVDPGDAGRHELTDAVPEDRVRRHPPRAPQLCQRVLHREQGRLRVLRLIEQLRIFPVDDGEQRPGQAPFEDLRAPIKRLAEHGLRLVQLTPHAQELGALAGEQEGHLPESLRSGFALSATRAGRVSREGHQLRRGLLGRGRHHRETVHEVCAPRVGGEASIRERLLTMREQVLGHLASLRTEGLVGHRRERQNVRRPLSVRTGLGGSRWHGGLLQHHVRIRPAQPERAHPRHPCLLSPLPLLPPSHHSQPAPLQLYPRVQRLEVHVLRQLLLLQRQHRLDQTRYPRRRLKVPHVRLHRAHRAQPSPFLRRAQHLLERLHLDRVPQRRPRPVRLEIAHLPGLHACALQRLAQQRLLRQHIRRRQPRAPPVLVHC